MVGGRIVLEVAKSFHVAFAFVDGMETCREDVVYAKQQ